MITVGFDKNKRSSFFMDNVTLLDKAIIKEYTTALYNSQGGHNELMQRFKINHLKEYKVISAMYRKRVAIKECLQIIEDMEEPIFWFTLTFNSDKDANTVETKRKTAQRFLNELSICYLMVEEYGEDKGRYHIHGFLCFKYGRGFLDFKEGWHSRQKLELIEGAKLKRKTRYLTKYASKQVPRLRRSKTMSKLCNYRKAHKGMCNCFHDVYIKDFKNYVAKVVNPF